MTTYKERLGRRIRSARELAKMTQRQLAQRIGVQSSVAICNYEKGNRSPSIEKLSLISQAVGTPIDCLVPKAELAEPEPLEGQTTIFEVLGDD